MTEPENDQSEEEPIRLEGAQQDIRDAYFEHNAGLFTLDCVPGAGKSVVTHSLPAEEVLRRYVSGDPIPEQRVAVVSFARDEAASIVPDICDRLQTIVEHELIPEASEISEEELAYLVQRVRRAPYMGTIDSFLRGVLTDIAHDVGFKEVPAVGNEARIRRVHRECYRRLQQDRDLQRRLEALEAAYPEEEYVDDIAALLRQAVEYCRDQRVSVETFRGKLVQTRESVYEEGPPDSFDDVISTIGNRLGDDGRAERLRESVEASDQKRIVEADCSLHDAWCARINDFCAVLTAYREQYRTLLREQDVVSHTDVAYLVAAYFDDDTGFSNEWLSDIDPAHRDRVLRRYRSRLRSLLIDEAQDVSAIQHAALSHFTTKDMRVFAAGDAMQGIYGWRHANPRLFETAVASGEYLSNDWEVHETRSATTTYRCVPDIAAAINTVAKPMFDDPNRGNIGELDVKYPMLEAVRDGTDDASVHIASFDSMDPPGSSDWISPEHGQGEAGVLATYLASGLADGTFTDDDAPLGITVLFRRRRWMDIYEEVFEAEGLRVRNASTHLFDAPSVKVVLAVCDWLVEPASPKRTRELVTESPLGLTSLADTFETEEWRLDDVLETGLVDTEISEDQRGVLDALRRLRDRCDLTAIQPSATYLESVIEILSLRADQYGILSDTDPEQRVANLDLFVETVAGWEDDDRYSLTKLLDLLDPFRESPNHGPSQASTSGIDYDVEFRTIHSMKGDQNDVVVLADPGFDIWSNGPHTQLLVGHGGLAGLAPPVNSDVPDDVELSPFDGLYAPAAPWDRDAGLRWGTALWSDDVSDSAAARLISPDRLRRVAAVERAESWRLLYVAATRASDHLVVPLPRRLPFGSKLRDRWLDTLRDGLQFPDECTDSYMLDLLDTDPNGEGIEIAVNDVDPFTHRSTTLSSTLANVAVSPADRSDLEPWIPRFVSPSILYPLTDDPEGNVIPHLLGEAIHTDTNDVSDELPLTFDQLGPDAVGTLLHDVLTELVEREIPAGKLCVTEPEVRTVFDDVVRDVAPRITDTEHDELLGFFEQVLDDFRSSNLWADITHPDSAVRTELPIDGIVTVDDVEIEVHGEADFVIEWPDESRKITDVKITLTEPTEEARKRYELQTATYAHLLATLVPSPGSVERTVETFGVTDDTISSDWPTEIVERRLALILST